MKNSKTDGRPADPALAGTVDPPSTETYADGLARLSAARPDALHTSPHVVTLYAGFKLRRRLYLKTIPDRPIEGPDGKDGRDTLHLWLFALATREGLGVEVTTYPSTPGKEPVEASAVVWTWHREPSGGLTPHRNEMAYAEHVDATLALLTALAAALSAGGIATDADEAPDA